MDKTSGNEEVFHDSFEEQAAVSNPNRPKRQKPMSGDSEDMTDQDELKLEMRLVGERVEKVLEMIGKIWDKFELFGERVKVVEDRLDRQSEEVSTVKKGFTKIEEKLSDVDEEVGRCCVKIKMLENRLIDLGARGRRNNLVFFGVEEREDENCVNIVRQFAVKCGVEKEVVIERAHRIPPRNRGNIGNNASRPRPLIAKFLNFNDAVSVKKGWKKLPHGISVNEDLPVEIREARAKLVPELRELKRQNKDAWIAYPARLMVAGREVRKEIPKSRAGERRESQPGDFRQDDDYRERGSNSGSQQDGWRNNTRGAGRGRGASRGGSSRGGR